MKKIWRDLKKKFLTPGAGNGAIFLFSVIVSVFPFYFWIFRKYLFLDFWHDEKISLASYIVVPLKTCVTTYFLANNHIFHNLIISLFLHVIRVRDLLLVSPGMVRPVELFFSTVTIIYLYLIGKRYFNRFVAFFSVIILVTTIPFFNFAVQVRGYALSMTLLTVLIYYLWDFEERHRRSAAIMIVVTATLLLYTIPLNLYVVLGVLFYYAMSSIRWHRSTELSEATRFSIRASRMVALLLGLSIILACLLYLPVLRVLIETLTQNAVLRSHGRFNWNTLKYIFPQTVIFFMSHRLFLFFVLISGLVIFPGKVSLVENLRKRYIFCFSLFLAPFMLSFIRGDVPFCRVFINVVPLFALFVGINVFIVFDFFLRHKRSFMPLVVLGLAVYCHVVFICALHDRDDVLKEAIVYSQRPQNIYGSFKFSVGLSGGLGGRMSGL